MDQVKLFKGCLPQILLGPFLNALSHLYFMYFQCDTRLYEACRLRYVCVMSIYHGRVQLVSFQVLSSIIKTNIFRSDLSFEDKMLERARL